jgi:hypothetical protein
MTGQAGPDHQAADQQQQTRMNEMRMKDKSGAGAVSQKDSLGITHHTNIQMEASPFLSNSVTEMDEVQTAKAVVTESNVYVAVQLEEKAKRNNANGQAAADSRIPKQKGHDGVLNDVNRDAAPAGQKNTGVESGITGNSYDYYQGKNAERALDSNLQASTIPSGIHQKIVEKVRSLSGPNIHHIYVSDDPQMLQAFVAYEQQAGGKTNWNDHVNELNLMANRVFPTNEGSGAYGGSISSGQTEHVHQHKNGPSYGERTGTK